MYYLFVRARAYQKNSGNDQDDLIILQLEVTEDVIDRVRYRMSLFDVPIYSAVDPPDQLVWHYREYSAYSLEEAHVKNRTSMAEKLRTIRARFRHTDIVIEEEPVSPLGNVPTTASAMRYWSNEIINITFDAALYHDTYSRRFVSEYISLQHFDKSRLKENHVPEPDAAPRKNAP